MRAGRLRNVEASASSDDPGNLLDPGNLRAEARAEKASVSVPAIGIDFVNGSAGLAFDGETLRASGLDAQTGGVNFSDAQLAVALRPEVRFDHGEGAFEADLAKSAAGSRVACSASPTRARSWK